MLPLYPYATQLDHQFFDVGRYQQGKQSMETHRCEGTIRVLISAVGAHPVMNNAEIQLFMQVRKIPERM
jgi:hypothetical protein